jgi:L-lactate dehydrogenase complex protein LldG
MTQPPASPGETRDAFLARVRQALEHDKSDAPAEPAPAVDEALVRLASAEDDLPTLFARHAEDIGLKVHRVASREAAEKVVALLEAIGAKRLVCCAGATGEAIGLLDALGDRYTFIEPDAEGFGPCYDSDAGISDVNAALAETGTLICCAGHDRPRATSLVPPNHLALVRASDILPDMIDYFARLKGIPGRDLPSSQAFITGPSKTADIEGVLVTGVHGPGRVDVVLIEDL